MTADLRIVSLKIPLADGAGLSNAMLITTAPEVRRTAVLIRTPYPRLICLHDNSGLEIASAGYSVVIQSTRGRHGSDGSFIPFLTEEEDGAAALEWCTKQPWCDGRFFLVGKSYEGFAAWAASASKTPGILGLAVSMTASRPQAWFYEGDLFRQAFAQSWGLSLAYTDERLPPREFPAVLQHARDLAALYRVDPRLSPLRSLLPGYLDWLRQESLSSIGSTFASERTVPLHLTTGWHDIFLQGAIDDARSRALPCDHLVIGPWSHDTIGQRLVGVIDYGVYATTGEFNVLDARLGWMRAVLSDICAGKTLSFSFGSNTWIASETWPPDSTSFTMPLMIMRVRGSVNEPYEAEISRSRYVVTPGGRLHDPLLPLAGGFDITTLLEKDECVSLISPPVEVNQQLVGDASFSFWAVSDEAFPLIAWLAMKTEDQGFITLSSGALLVTPQKASREIVVAFRPFAALLPTGARLVIVLSYSSLHEYAQPPLSEVPIRVLLGKALVFSGHRLLPR